MAKYRVVVDKAPVRADKSVSAEVMTHFPKDHEFEGERLPGITGFIKVIEPSPPGPNAFVIFTSVREIVAQAIPEPIGEAEDDIFCQLVTRAARQYGPERDYLMAVAYAGTNNLSDFGSEASKDVGPFRITAEEWKEAITTGVAKDMGFSEGDRLLWYRQPTVAALRAADCAKRLRHAIGQDKDPTFAEVYFVQRLGAGAEDLLKGNRDRLCSVAISGTPASGSYAAQVASKTVKSALEELHQRLVGGLAEALKVIDRQHPDVRFFRATERNGHHAPWLAVALDEMDRIVVEIPGDENNDRIALYHRTAQVADTRDETPWCASFVTYCMKECGVDEVAKATPSQPASAFSWKEWGEEVPLAEAPEGAVVFLQPEGPGSGHVGFLMKREGNLIHLLGGNQGDPDQVGTVRFPVDENVKCFWHNFASGLSADKLKQIFPACPDADRWARAISMAWHRFGIVTRSAQAGFLGITGNETGEFVNVRREDMTYTPQRAAQVWPGRAGNNTGFPTLTCKEKIQNGEQSFANWIYAGINGNGTEASGDGWKYRGGGIIQLTGRANYQACADDLAMPALMDDPDLVSTDAATSAAAAAWFVAQYAKLLSLLDNEDEASFLVAAGRVGRPPDAEATRRRLEFRKKALAIL